MRQPLLTRAALLCALGGVALVACAGAGDREPAELEADLSEELQDGRLALAPKDADCVSEVLVDEVGPDELEDVDLSADEPPAELAERLTAAARSAAERCELDAAALAG